MIKDGVLVGTGHLTGALARALVLVLVARALPPTEFGLLAAVIAGLAVAYATADLGVSKFLLRAVAADQRRDAAAAIRLNHRTTLIAAGVATTGLVLLGLRDHTFFLLLPLIISLGCEKYADTWMHVAVARRRPGLNAVNFSSRRLLSLALFLVAQRLGLPTVEAFLLGELTAAVLSVVFAGRYLRSVQRAEPGSLATRDLLKLTVPYWLNGLAMQTRTLDVVLMATLAPAAQSGYYAVGARVTGPLQLVASSLAMVIAPRAATSQRRDALVRFIVVVSLLLALLYALIALLAPLLVDVVLGEAYSSSAPVLQVLLAGLPFAAFSSMLSAALQGWSLDRPVARSSMLITVTFLPVFALVAGRGAVAGACVWSAAALVQASLLAAVALRAVRAGTAQADEPTEDLSATPAGGAS